MNCVLLCVLQNKIVCQILLRCIHIETTDFPNGSVNSNTLWFINGTKALFNVIRYYCLSAKRSEVANNISMVLVVIVLFMWHISFNYG